MHTGRLIAGLLAEYGVSHVFGVPGGHTLLLYEGIRDTDGISHVLMHDERSAGYAADGYARVTGRTAVCDATVGPGATNLPSAVAEAYASSIPMVAIVSDLERKWAARRERGSVSQGMRQREMFETITKWHATIDDAAAAEEIVDAAFRIANTGRPGPVALFVPEDVFKQAQPADAIGGNGARHRPQASPWVRTGPDPRAVASAARTILRARRPAILAGGGVHLSGAYASLANLGEFLACPIATTIAGKGAIGEGHRLAVGVAGSMGSSAVNEILAAADCLIMVGTRAGQVAMNGWELPAPHASVVHIDADPEEAGRTISRALPVVGDAQLCLDALLDSVRHAGGEPTTPRFEWNLGELQRQVAEWRAAAVAPPDPANLVRPQKIMQLLTDRLAPEDVLVADASSSSGWSSTYTVLRSSGRRFLAPRGMGGLGWSLPAGIGAAVGARQLGKAGHRIYVIAGDGGFAYSVQELETAARLELPITVVLLNNNCFGWIKQTLRARGLGDLLSAAEFRPVDFAAVSAGFGVPASHCDDASQLADALEAAKRTKGPELVQVACDGWETPSIRLAATLGTGGAVLEGGEGL